jgi:hypothetical protein
LRSIEQGQAFDVTLLIKDVLTSLTADTLTIRQLRNGGLGKYGRTYNYQRKKFATGLESILNQLNKIDYKKL